MVFNIQPAHFRNAKKLGVEIKPSKVKNKKIDVFISDDKVASIGDTRYNDYESFKDLEGIDFANNRRRLYRIRHNKDRNKIGTPSFYADKILW